MKKTIAAFTLAFLAGVVPAFTAPPAPARSRAKVNVVGQGINTFDISTGTFQTLVLTQDTPSVTVTNFDSGELIVFRICQNSAGGFKFTWPANVVGAQPVTTIPSACTVQAFATFDNRQLLAIGAVTP
jgi:hypothetical protein